MPWNIFQVDIEHTSVFFPRRHIKFPEPRGMSNIPRTLHEMFTRRILPETLVVSFPKVKLHSVGHKPVGAMQILPIKTLTQSVAGEQLGGYHQISNIRCTNPQTYMCRVSPCSHLCAIYWSQVLSREWRCCWSSVDRRCSNYIWVINNFIAH